MQEGQVFCMLNTKDFKKYSRNSNGNERKNKLAERIIRKWQIRDDQ